MASHEVLRQHASALRHPGRFEHTVQCRVKGDVFPFAETGIPGTRQSLDAVDGAVGLPRAPTPGSIRVNTKYPQRPGPGRVARAQCAKRMMRMNVMNHTPLRDLLEDAEARGSVDADEMEAAIAGLDLTEEDEADLRRQLDELDVEVVVRARVRARRRRGSAALVPHRRRPRTASICTWPRSAARRFSPSPRSSGWPGSSSRVTRRPSATWSRPTCASSCRSRRSTAVTACRSST